MNGFSSFTARFLSAPEYVYALHEPSDHAAVLIRNRIRQQTTQRILPAETIASAPFQSFVVRVHHETEAIYHGQDFRVQQDSPESPHHLGDSRQSARKISAGHRSQSEADWAYAKRALARGDHPDQIIQRIADFRTDDKADPAYYARLTVIKAQLSLMSPEASTPTATIDSSRVVDRDL